MSPARAGLATLFAIVCPIVAQAQGLTIEHSPVACIVAGKYPRLNACFVPAGEVVKPRVNFKMKGAPASYYTEMKSDMPCHVGFLPRPKKELIGQEIEIWLEGMDRAFNPARSPEYTVKVVGSEAECKDLPVAPFVSNAAVTVFPAMAPGFVASTVVPTLGLVAGAGAVAIGTGTYLATREDDSPSPAPTPGPGPTPAPTPTPTPAPTPTPTPTPGATLTVDCAVRPRSGTAPLTVTLTALASGITGPVDYRWDFGDGASATDRDTTHTYTAPGVFRAVVTATGGGQEARCDRNVSVTAAAQVQHALDVRLVGTGAGTVASSPSGIACPGACSAIYADNTVVSLTATPDAGSTFAGWGGACSGTGACTVTLNADRSVTAQFDKRGSTATLTVTTTTGKGFGAVTADVPPGGIVCPSDCTEVFPVPTTVTLQAAPQANSFFAGWNGGGCTGTGSCTVTLTGDTTVNAVFEPIQARLTLTCHDNRFSRTQTEPAGSVSVTPSVLVCNSDPTPVTVSQTYSAGTNLVLTATSVGATESINWGGDCAFVGSTSASSSTCNLTLPAAGATVDVSFTTIILTSASKPDRPAPGAEADGVALAWRHQLDAAGAAGHVLLNGATTVAAGPGLNAAQAHGRPGENRIEGRLTRTGRAGTWRFELGGNARLEPGSIRVLSGEPAVVTGDTIVFRLRGQSGEQVAFTFKLKP